MRKKSKVSKWKRGIPVDKFQQKTLFESIIREEEYCFFVLSGGVPRMSKKKRKSDLEKKDPRTSMEQRRGCNLDARTPSLCSGSEENSKGGGGKHKNGERRRGGLIGTPKSL